MNASPLAFLNTPEGRLRVLSAVVLAPLFLGLVSVGGIAYTGLIIGTTSIGLYEWMRLIDPSAPLPDRCGMFAADIFALCLAATGQTAFGFLVIVIASIAFFAHRSNRTDAEPAFWFALGLPYMAISGVALIGLRSGRSGLPLTIFLLAAVWGMDVGAYIVGRMVGGPKLAPSISPNKTWAGFFGGLGLAVLLTAPVLLVFHARSFSDGLEIAILLGAIAQGGDLFKSFFKRRAGVKDCGQLIPGHGGVLDRIDGLVFAGMALAFLRDISGNCFLW